MSRRLDALEPVTRSMAERVLYLAEASDLELLIYCTRRTVVEQAKLFRRGRSFERILEKERSLREDWGRDNLADVLLAVGPQHGQIVTNAGPGQSLHNYGMAFDAVPLIAGKAVWGRASDHDCELWELYGRICVEAGLEWAGNWASFREFPHAQRPGITWRDLIEDATF